MNGAAVIVSGKKNSCLKEWCLLGETVLRLETIIKETDHYTETA